MSSNVQAVELVFLLLLLFVVAFGALARKLQIAYPIVLVIAGGLLGFVPGIPRIALNPDVSFFVILPPLLYSAAWTTSWREFSYNMVSILLLAFGLVTFTVICVALGTQWFFSGFDWKLGLVLGAVGQTEPAIAAYRSALALQPDQTDWRFELALLLYGQRELGDTRTELLTVLTQQPKHAAARKLLEAVSLERAKKL